ncbi:MAG: ribonuclease HII [Flavobacteriaceae bacterium]
MKLKPSFQSELVEAGLDEAGRGCLAGPVVAAAVILPEGFESDVLNDSKQLNKKNRDLLRVVIEREAKAFAVSFVSEREIEKINILNASILAMNNAVAALKIRPEFLAVDGNRFKSHHDIDYECVVKGDGKYLNIAAASILAKTYRDEYMEKLSKELPVYQWQKNQGYPTKAHRLAIAEFGATKHHRKTFKLLPDQLSLDLIFESE